MKTLAKKANEQIQRIKEWYEEHESAFEYMDLKLHDVSYYCCSKMVTEFPLCYANDRNDEYSYFYLFCDDEYRCMNEFLADNHKIKFNDFWHQLGRTSSFYLHNQDVFKFERHQINWYWTMNGIVSEIYGTYYGNYTEFDENGDVNLAGSLAYIEANYSDKEGAMESLKNELEWLATEMFDDVQEYFADMFVVYDYIKNFKENQVEYFKEWLQFYEDEHAEEKRKEMEREIQRQSLIAKFENPALREVLNKYVHNNKAIEELLQTV